MIGAGRRIGKFLPVLGLIVAERQSGFDLIVARFGGRPRLRSMAVLRR